MHRRSFVSLAAAFAAPLWMGWAGPAHADNIRITGPVVHANLALYFIAAGESGVEVRDWVHGDRQYSSGASACLIVPPGDESSLAVSQIGDHRAADPCA